MAMVPLQGESSDARAAPRQKFCARAAPRQKFCARATNTALEVEGNDRMCEYNRRMDCPVEVGGKRAIFVSASYKKPPSDQPPSLVKCTMKRGFGAIHWFALSGRWGWMMDAYPGRTSEEIVKGA